MSNRKQIEALEKEKSDVQAKLRAATHRQKYLESAEKKLTWKERTHRLCTRGGMLEKFLIEPGVLSQGEHDGRERRRRDAEFLTLDKGRNYTPLSVLTAF